MAEGLLERLFGGEAEAAEVEVGEGLVSAEAFAAALAEEETKRDPEVARAAAQFLRDQSTLLRSQTEEMEDHRALRLSNLRGQALEGRLRRFGQRLRNGMQMVTALVVALAGVGLCVIIYGAFTTNSVVVEAFDTPPALLARGLSGKVVAGGLLDELTRLQAATRSSAAKRHLSNAWTNEIKVEVPETGMALSEIERMVKARFGHDQHIEGDLVQTDTGGLTLTVRGDHLLPKVFNGGAGDLDKLTTQAAEYIYGQSEPALFAVYLREAGRNAEAVAFARAPTPPPARGSSLSLERVGPCACEYGRRAPGDYRP